jgi:hypothetical protein
MACPHVRDGEDSGQIWRVSANIVIKESRTVTRGGPPPRGLSEGLATHHREEKSCYEMLHRTLELDGFFGGFL